MQIAEFVYEQPALQEAEYVFKQALTQEVAYNSLLIERRKLLHEQIGAIIETLYKQQLADHADELAHHYRLSGNKEKEINSQYYAGAVACWRFAYAQAITYLTNALRLLENSSRDSTAKESWRFEILLNLGMAQAGEGDPKSGNRSICGAAEIAKRSGDPKRLVRAALQLRHLLGVEDLEAISVLEEALDTIGSEDCSERAYVMSWLACFLAWSQELVRARTLARDSIVIARRVGDKPTLFGVLYNAFRAFHQLRDFAIPDDVQERITLGLEAQHLADDLKAEYGARVVGALLYDVFLESGDVKSANEQLARLALLPVEKSVATENTYWLTLAKARMALISGRFNEGQQLAYEALALGQQAHDPRAFENMGLQLAIIYFEEGHLGDLESTFRSNVQANPNQPAFRCALATLYAEQSRRDETASEFESLARNDFRDLPRVYNWLIGIALLALVCDFLGDSERASILYEIMTPYRRRNITVGAVSLGSVELYLGLLASTMSRFEEARAHFEAALEFNSKMGALPWVARSQYEYARMLLKFARASDRERACQLLAAAYETAEQLGMKKINESTQKLLLEAEN